MNGSLAGSATRAPGPPAEAQQIESELREIASLIDGIDGSVSYARNQLWGPTPEKDGRNAPSVVEPSGILPGTLHRVRVIRNRLQALAEAAGHLRNI